MKVALEGLKKATFGRYLKAFHVGNVLIEISNVFPIVLRL